MKRTHLIWDFDGTLYDTYPAMTEALLAALRHFGVSADAQEAYALIKQTLFHGVTCYAQRFSLPVEALLAQYRQLHTQQRAFPPMPGLQDCLTAATTLGCHHYLFTHRDRGAIAQLQADGLATLFTDFVTREDGFADKPAPDALLHLMRKHGFSAQQALMIGDRALDMESGAAAGIAGVLMDPQGLSSSTAVSYRIDCLAQVLPLLRL